MQLVSFEETATSSGHLRGNAFSDIIASYPMMIFWLNTIYTEDV